MGLGYKKTVATKFKISCIASGGRHCVWTVSLVGWIWNPQVMREFWSSSREMNPNCLQNLPFHDCLFVSVIDPIPDCVIRFVSKWNVISGLRLKVRAFLLKLFQFIRSTLISPASLERDEISLIFAQGGCNSYQFLIVVIFIACTLCKITELMEMQPLFCTLCTKWCSAFIVGFWYHYLEHTI